MQNTLLTIILFGVASGRIDLSFWSLYEPTLIKEMEERLPEIEMTHELFTFVVKDTKRAEFIAQSTKEFLQHEQLNDITFDKELGSGTYGFVYRGKVGAGKEPVCVKLMIDRNGRYPDCNYAWANYQLVASAKVPYLVGTKKPILKHFRPSVAGQKSLYMCAMVMEMGTSADNIMFTKITAAEKQQNNDNFIDFSRRLLRTFKVLNHDGKIFHADIKPQNVLWKYTENGLEPRLIDFDLTFKMLNAKFNPGWTPYTLRYRPPELSDIVPLTNPTDDHQQHKMQTYEYNGRFLEEAWAVGRTLKDIYHTNKLYLDEEEKRMMDLVDIFHWMLEPEMADRIDTEQALDLAMKIPTRTNKLKHVI